MLLDTVWHTGKLYLQGFDVYTMKFWAWKIARVWHKLGAWNGSKLKLQQLTYNLGHHLAGMAILVNLGDLIYRDFLLSGSAQDWKITCKFIFVKSQMLQVNVSLPNGCHEVLSVEPSSKVQDLQIAAQQTFGRRFLRLVTAKKRVLDNPEETIETAGLERRVSYACCSSATISCNRSGLCLVVLWGTEGRYVGPPCFWRRQLSNSRSAQECAEDSGHGRCICGDFGRWIGCHLGGTRKRRWLFSSPCSAQKCPADSVHTGGPSSRLLHLDVLGAPRALCWQ